MALTVIGGSNYMGRFLIRNLFQDYPEVRLADMYPFRDAVYGLQEELNLPLQKFCLSYPSSLRASLEGAKTAVVVTHDYFKLAYSKNFYLEKTALMAKKSGVERLICVCPLEFDQLNKLDGDPQQLITDAENKAKEHFPQLSLLKCNLVFGPSATSLLLAHAIQEIKNNRRPVSCNHGHSKFQPVHHDEVLALFKKIAPGESHVISGPEVLNWVDITRILAKSMGKETPDHGTMLDSFVGWVATCQNTGDIIYPSHIQQLYRLLSSDFVPSPTVTGKITMKESYQETPTVGEYHWNRVIVD